MDPERVILIDDNPDTARELERALTGAGLQVDSVRGAEDAAPLLRERDYRALFVRVAAPFPGNLRSFADRLGRPAAAGAPAPEAEAALSWGARSKRIARNAGLFLAAPFISTFYMLALPFVATWVFAKNALDARKKKAE